MIALLLLLSCGEEASADGVPPFPDGLPSDAAEETGAPPAVSIVAVDRAAVEDPAAPSPLELMDADGLPEEGGETIGVALSEPLTLQAPQGMVQVDPALLIRPEPPRPLVRLADEILAAASNVVGWLAVIAGFLRMVWPVIKRIGEEVGALSEAVTGLLADVRALRDSRADLDAMAAEGRARGAALAKLSEAHQAVMAENARLRAAQHGGLAAQRTMAEECERTCQVGQDALT